MREGEDGGKRQGVREIDGEREETERQERGEGEKRRGKEEKTD